MLNDSYLNRVAVCRVPGRVMTLKKRLAAIMEEAKLIRAELAKLTRLKEALQ